MAIRLPIDPVKSGIVAFIELECQVKRLVSLFPCVAI